MAKLHKIHDRQDPRRHQSDNVAHDIYRLLQAIPTGNLSERLKLLSDNDLCAEVTKDALTYLSDLFGNEGGVGAQMAARHEGELGDYDFVVAACAALTQDLLNALSA